MSSHRSVKFIIVGIKSPTLAVMLRAGQLNLGIQCAMNMSGRGSLPVCQSALCTFINSLAAMNNYPLVIGQKRLPKRLLKPLPLLRKKTAKKAYLYDDTKNGTNIKGILLIKEGGSSRLRAIVGLGF
jgi:hypothetical protein